MIASDTANVAQEVRDGLATIATIARATRGGYDRLLERLADQAREAWRLGQAWPLPADFRRPSRVLLVGVGGSAIGADVAATFARLQAWVPVEVMRHYGVPRLERDALVIACSFSGETEETLAAFDSTSASGCMRIALTTGGRLAQDAEASGVPLIRYAWDGPPRTGFGFGLFTLLAVLARLDVFELDNSEVKRALAGLSEATACYRVDAANNPAQRVAIDLVGRVPVIIGADFLDVAARRFASEVNENAKQWAFSASLPEFNHNGLQALAGPDGTPMPLETIILDSTAIHARNRVRVRRTAEVLREHGARVRVLDAGGNTPLEAIVRACVLGSWVSYYLALLRGVDPLPVATLDAFKRRMSSEP